MILAKDKRFIFVHVPKAAGTSINSALSMHDVFFPVRSGNAAARVKHAESAGLSPATAQLGEHATAKQFAAALGADDYKNYYSFGFVRNPWDVAVSWFHYRLINAQVAGHKEAEAAGNFQAYVRKHLTGPEARRWVGLQYPFLVDETDAVAVSFVGRYETLTQDFGTVAARLNIATLELDHFNQSYHPTWTQLYTRETFEIVHALVATDAKLFGYPSDPAFYGIN